MQLFIACQTQWVVGGMGAIIGLNYVAVEAVAKLKRCWNEETLDKLRVMESEALKLFSKK